MEQNKFRIAFIEGSQTFLESLPYEAKEKIAYRLFVFWGTGKEILVVATHVIIKKTQKSPSKGNS